MSSTRKEELQHLFDSMTKLLTNEPYNTKAGRMLLADLLAKPDLILAPADESFYAPIQMNLLHVDAELRRVTHLAVGRAILSANTVGKNVDLQLFQGVDDVINIKKLAYVDISSCNLSALDDISFRALCTVIASLERSDIVLGKNLDTLDAARMQMLRAAIPSPFNTLPNEITGFVLPGMLSRHEIGILPQVSQSLKKLFQNEQPWKINLVNQFGINEAVLAKFEKLRDQKKISFNYKELYLKYYRLTMIYEVPITDTQRQYLMLASCVNDISILEWISREDRDAFLEFVIRAGSNKIFIDGINMRLWTLNFDKISMSAFSYGTIDMVRVLLALTNKNGERLFRPNEATLMHAIKFGIRDTDRIAIVRVLLALTNKQGRPLLARPDQKYLNEIICSGLEAKFESDFLYLLKLRDQHGQLLFLPTQQALDRTARLGKVKMFRELLALKNENGQRLLTPNQTTLNLAARSGNIELVRELLAIIPEKDELQLSPTIETLNDAARSGNVELVRELLSFKNPLGKQLLTPTIETLKLSANAGSLEMVRELLSFKNEQGQQLLKPNTLTLLSAVYANNVELVRYLLALKNENGERLLTPDLDTLDKTIYRNTNVVHELLTLKNEKNQRYFTPKLQNLHEAIKEGRIEIVRELLALKDELGNRLLTPTQDSLILAVAPESTNAGKIEIVRELLSLKNKDGERLLTPNMDTLNVAAQSGSLEIVREILSQKNEEGDPFVIPNQNTLNEATRSQNTELLRELLALTDEQGHRLLIANKKILDIATKSGDVELVREVLAVRSQNGQRFLTPDQQTFKYAIESESVEIVRELSALTDEQGRQLWLPNDGILFLYRRNYKLYNHIFPSVIAMNAALINLQKGYDDIARIHLQKSYDDSPRYFFSEMKQILEYPSKYNLDVKTVKLLQSFIQDLIAREKNNSKLPLCEKETVNEMNGIFTEMAKKHAASSPRPS